MTSSKDKARMLRWQRANPEKVRQYKRNHRREHRAPCYICGGPMPWPSPGRKYCSGTCRSVGEKALMKGYNKAWRTKVKRKVWTHKENIGCSHCKYNKHGVALEWHHPAGDKERRLTPGNYFNKIGKAERDKCVLLCANCHRIEHVRLNDLAAQGEDT